MGRQTHTDGHTQGLKAELGMGKKLKANKAQSERTKDEGRWTRDEGRGEMDDGRKKCEKLRRSAKKKRVAS